MSPQASGEPLWRQHFREAAALGLRVAVVDRSARILAHANLDGHVICPAVTLIDDKWLEFVEPDDVPALRAAFATPLARAIIHYRQLCQISGQPGLCRITLLNVWCGQAWLSYGALRPLPAPRPQRSLSDQA